MLLINVLQYSYRMIMLIVLAFKYQYRKALLASAFIRIFIEGFCGLHGLSIK